MRAAMRLNLVATLGILAVVAGADTITVDGQVLHGVLVRQSATLYYVQDPTTGTVRNVPKSSVHPSDFVATTDPAERAALQSAWKTARAQVQPPIRMIEAPQTTAPAASAERESDRPVPLLTRRGSLPADQRSDGRVPYLRLRDVPLRSALDATLRPMGLDYVDAGGYIFISTPERLAHESFERVETRTYNVALDNTLPKIVLRNPAVGARASGGGAVSVGNGGFGGQTGFGGAGIGGGFGGAQGGGFAQRGAGAGGAYSGGTARNTDVTAISNISDLFTTIDDRLVGETPAQIGLGISTLR